MMDLESSRSESAGDKDARADGQDLSSTDNLELSDEMNESGAEIGHAPTAGTRNDLGKRVTKRAFDIFGAVLLSILAAPAILMIAIIIRSSGSPVIFGHERIGKGRKLFSCYKFRSMNLEAESDLQELLTVDPKLRVEWEENHKLRNDPRITRFGEFLRKSSLDELPQLWNVIKGEMSLVGPRPVVEDELERYGRKAPVYCSVKPGITGLWQISGRSNVTYSRRVSLDALYVRNQTLVLDLWILFCTVKVVAKRVGAH